MKNLHKKIGAMVLAGMVVLGGVAAGGVNSFAASSKASVSNSIKELQEKRVKNIIKDYGEILLVDSDQKKIDEFVKEKHSSIGRKYQKKCGERLRNPYQIPVILQNFKRSGKKLIKVHYQDFYYLIQVK